MWQMLAQQANAGDENVRELSDLGSSSGAKTSGESEGVEVSDINKATIRGRAAADASIKTLPNSTLTTLRIGTDGSYTGRDGRKVERVDWHMVACWGAIGEQAQSIRKGDVVQVEGPIRTRSYGEGASKKWITEIVASKVTVDAREREPQVERDDAPPLVEDDIPF